MEYLRQILIIGDSPEEAELLIGELSRAGFMPQWRRVATADDLKAALDEQQWDILISDYSIPGFGGMPALQISADKGCDAPFIIISDRVGEAAIVEAIKAGVRDFIFKDNLTRLVPVIRRELGEVRERCQRRQLLEKLQQSEQRYQALFDSAPISIWEEDFSKIKEALDDLRRQGVTDFRKYMSDHPEFVRWAAGEVRVIDVNSATLKMYGASSREELLGSLDKIFTPESFKAILDTLLAIAEEKEYYEAETANRTLTGETLQIMARISIPKNDASFKSMIVSIIDITARKEMELALRSSEERYRRVAETSQEGVCVLDAEARITFISSRVAEMLGYTMEEMIGRSVYDFTDPEFAMEHKDIYERRRHGERALYDLCSRRKDGEKVWHLVSTTPMFDEEGSFKGAFAMLTDITARKETEVRLRESEAMIRNVTDQALVGIYVVQDGLFKYVNPKVAELTGYTVEEMLAGKVCYRDIIIAEDLPMVEEKVAQRLSGKIDSIQYQFRARRRDGEIVEIEVYGRRIEYGGKPAILGTILDVTERNRAAEQLRGSNAQLRSLSAHLEKVREMERQSISRNIHDELGQALTALKYDVNWLSKRLSQSDAVIVRKLDDVGKLIDGTIRDVQRITSELRPRLLDDLGLEAAMEWLVRDMTRRTSITCSLKVEAELDNLGTTSATAIYRILQESLTNVIRHSEASRVSIRCWQANDQIVLEVKDNGKGIKLSEFESDSSYGIMGMRERARICGGDVGFTVKKGTTVRVTVPLNCKETT